MKLQAHKVAAWMDGFKAKTSPALILLYGPDAGGVMEAARQIKNSYLGQSPDPLQYVQLADSVISSQPGMLLDEAAAIPMFGDRKLVLVTGTGGKVNEALKIFLANPPPQSLVIVEAGNLLPSAAVRKLAEGHDQAMALPFYMLDARDITPMARQFLQGEHYNIEAAALDILVARLTTDRGVMQRDLEKLVLYKGLRQPSDEKGMISLEDIDAVLGNATQANLSQLVDCVAGGQVKNADHVLDLLVSSGTPAEAALPAVRTHFQTLHLVLGLMENGTSQNAAMSSFRPPLHFKRKPLVENQLRLWTRRKVARALSLVQQAELACRGASRGMAHAHAGQVLLRLSRAAKR